MTIRLRDRVTMPAALRKTLPISGEDILVSLGMMLFEPREQSGTKVETDPRVITDSSVRRITLVVNTLVPIVIRRRTRLWLDFAGPGVFARGLVEVSVDD
jgi:hypothetical protein